MVATGVGGGLAVVGMPMLESLGSVFWSVQNENILTAIPLFILLGEILLRSGLADRMYIGLSSWVSGLPGGLLHTNIGACGLFAATCGSRSEEPTSELQSLMRISYAVFCLKKKKYLTI